MKSFSCAWKVYYFCRLLKLKFLKKSHTGAFRNFAICENLIYTWRRWVLHEKQGHPHKTPTFEKEFSGTEGFLGGSCLIWYRRHENRPASCWFRRKSWKYLGDTRIPVKLPFGQAFLKLCTVQLNRGCSAGVRCVLQYPKCHPYPSWHVTLSPKTCYSFQHPCVSHFGKVMPW